MTDILQRVFEVKKGEDPNLRNDLIADYIPFIINNVSKTTGYYINSEDSDEFSIGLGAFNEAIDRYESDKGSFIGFASLVIRSRVKDFMRKEWKYNQEVSLDEQVLDRQAIDVNEDLVAEIETFKSRLSEFNITLDDLISDGPKHEKTRYEIVELGANVSENDGICKKLYTTKKLPMAEIILRYQTTKKRLKTFRSFIIGVVVVFREKLEMIKSYMHFRGE